MAVDLSVYGKVKTLADQMRSQEEEAFNRRLVQSQIAKNEQLDVDKLGEVAFMKAAQGIALTPQEHAAARYVDAKSGGIQFNPATGAIEQKPRISDKIGLDGMAPQGQGSVASPPRMGAPAATAGMAAPRTQPPALPPAFDGAGADNGDFYQQQYEASMRDAAGNPKAQQAIKEQYLKDRIKFNESQAKDAGFADRMMNANPDILDTQGEANTLWNYFKSSLPVVGNYLVDPEYQKFDRAQKDFINAQLRDESGAVISPGEFVNARKQYMPAPGDNPATLAEKTQAREIARQNMIRGAGPAYKPPSNYERGKAEFDAKKKGGAGGKVINWEDLP